MTKPEIKESNVSLIDYRKDKNIQLQMLKEDDADATVSIPTGKIPSNVEHLQTGDASVISSQSEDSSPKSSLKNADRPLTSSTTENRAFENETLNAGLDINSNCVAESSEVVTEQPTKTPISTRFLSMSDMADKGVAKNLKKEISSTSNIDERRDPVINNTTCTSRNQEDLKVKCEEALLQSPPSTNNECSHTPESSFKQKHQSLVQNSEHVAVGNSSPTFKYPAEIKNAFCELYDFSISVTLYSMFCEFYYVY